MATHDEFASDYDKKASEYKWFGPEVLLGLMYEFIEAEQTLLDIGIGTGLSSLPFQKAGLTIFGIDNSSQMLAICRAKEFTHELIEHDICKTPLPYPKHSFDHVISNGVFHLIRDLTPLVADVARLLKDLGTFGFSYQEWTFDLTEGYRSVDKRGVFETTDKESGVKVYHQTEDYVMNLLFDNGFTVWKKLEFVGNIDPKDGKKYYLRAVVAQKRGERSGDEDIIKRLLG
ncbi:MAG: class I SAM-dependent methyltransferase [Candidatus Latescibacterota bacterium]|nr:MAG: class I SAM-dependent methyltransferase [Candidatus Latescibacterota bacterium]